MHRLSPKNSQTVRISPQLIMRYELLRLPSQQLGAHLREMGYENPLLDVIEHALCPRCGQELPAEWAACPLCREESPLPTERVATGDEEARDEWMERIGDPTRLSQSLWRQCVESNFSAEELLIACHLIADLDEQGYLSSAPADYASTLQQPLAQIERVRQRMMRFEPLGIAARGAQECLLVQVESLLPQCPWAAVAQRVIAEQWDNLMAGKLRHAARALRLPLAEVERAVAATREQLYLYPAYSYHGHDEETIYLQPDVRFSLRGRGAAATIGVDVLEAQRYRVQLAPEYRDLIRQPIGEEGTRQKLAAWQSEVQHVAVALRQRWSTLTQVCESIAEFQRDFFLARGCPSGLVPLTRDEVANALGVHPSTVGRAVNGKYAELPTRQIVPLSFFFDSNAPIHALITQLITDETELLSDESLRDHLHRAGWSMTRRAVSLHRESMGILPTHLRRRQRVYAALR